MSTFTQQLTAVRGRGARSNETSRFEPQVREAFDDGWTADDEAPAQIATTVSPEKAKTIITHNDSPDVGFSASINPYRGCEHGCIYCYARPAHAYMGLSPGLDFETKLFFKPGAGDLLERELSRPRYVPEVIHVAGNTERHRVGGGRRGPRSRRRPWRRLCRVASAHGDRRPVPGVARHGSPGPSGPGHVARPPDAWRQDQRQPVWPAHERPGSPGRAHVETLRDRQGPLWPRGKAGAHGPEPVPRSAKGRRADRPVPPRKPG